MCIKSYELKIVANAKILVVEAVLTDEDREHNESLVNIPINDSKVEVWVNQTRKFICLCTANKTAPNQMEWLVKVTVL